jgi:hypothetical protein
MDLLYDELPGRGEASGGEDAVSWISARSKTRSVFNPTYEVDEIASAL